MKTGVSRFGGPLFARTSSGIQGASGTRRFSGKLFRHPQQRPYGLCRFHPL
jgi:hypothetical protein